MNTQKTESQDFRKTIIIDPDNVINNPYYEQTKHLSFLSYKKYAHIFSKFYKENKQIPTFEDLHKMLKSVMSGII